MAILVVKAQVPADRTLQSDDETQVFAKQCIAARDVKTVIETCSGIGCLGVGLEEAGFEVIARSDWNPILLGLAQKLHSSDTLLGDVCTDALLSDIASRYPSARTLAAGISCQPYSRLGDRRHQDDPRSQTLPAVLRLGFMNQFGVIILECVPEAHTCPWVQQMLKQFTKETGYCMSQEILHLQQVWPGRRSRWWCVVTHPSLGTVQLRPLPVVQPKPMVANVLQQFQHCDPDMLAQLQLDLYELGKFAHFGFDTNMVKWRGQMATSLHSCGNQLMACPCGCRRFPFTEQRLNSGGLHGLLIRLLGESKCGTNVYPNFRHISPDELALLNGMYPGCDWGAQSRLALCALGQLASPLQSAWIGAFVMCHFHERLGLSQPSQPEVVLLRLMGQLLKARDETFGDQTSSDCQQFQTMIKDMKFSMDGKSWGVHVNSNAIHAEASPCPGQVEHEDEQHDQQGLEHVAGDQQIKPCAKDTSQGIVADTPVPVATRPEPAPEFAQHFKPAEEHKPLMMPNDCTRATSGGPIVADGRSSFVGVQAGWYKPQTSEGLSKSKSQCPDLHVGMPGLSDGTNVGRPNLPHTGSTPDLNVTEQAGIFESGASMPFRPTDQGLPIVHRPVVHGLSEQPKPCPEEHKLPMLPKDCTRDASLSPNIGDGRSSHVGVQAGWCQPQTSESLSKVESEFREIHVGQPGLTGGPNVGRPSTPTTGPTPTMMITKKADNFESGALTFVQSTEQCPIVHCPVAHGPSMQSKPCNNHPPQGVTACTPVPETNQPDPAEKVAQPPIPTGEHQPPKMPHWCNQGVPVGPITTDDRSGFVGVQAGWYQPQTSEVLSMVQSEGCEFHAGQSDTSGGIKVGIPNVPPSDHAPKQTATEKGGKIESNALMPVRSTSQSLPIAQCPVAHGLSNVQAGWNPPQTTVCPDVFAQSVSSIQYGKDQGVQSTEGKGAYQRQCQAAHVECLDHLQLHCQVPVVKPSEHAVPAHVQSESKPPCTAIGPDASAQSELLVQSMVGRPAQSHVIQSPSHEAFTKVQECQSYENRPTIMPVGVANASNSNADRRMPTETAIGHVASNAIDRTCPGWLLPMPNKPWPTKEKCHMPLTPCQPHQALTHVDQRVMPPGKEACGHLSQVFKQAAVPEAATCQFPTAVCPSLEFAKPGSAVPTCLRTGKQQTPQIEAHIGTATPQPSQPPTPVTQPANKHASHLNDDDSNDKNLPHIGQPDDCNRQPHHATQVAPSPELDITDTQKELAKVEELLEDEAFEPMPNHGGVMGFEATKRRKIHHTPANGEGHTTANTIRASGGKSCPAEPAHKRSPLPVRQLTGVTADGGSLCGTPPFGAAPVSMSDRHPGVATNSARQTHQSPDQATSAAGNPPAGSLPHADPGQQEHTKTVWIMQEDSRIPLEIRVNAEVTPGQITQAEAKLGSMVQPIFPRSWVDSPLALYEPVPAKQFIHLHQHAKQTKCPLLTGGSTMPNLAFPCTRIGALWQQGPWVAQDEMDYYLSAAEVGGNISAFSPTVFHHEAAADEEAGVWLCHPIQYANENHTFVSAAIVANHWVPIVIQAKNNVVQLTTTPEGSCYIRAATEIANDMGKTLEVIQKVLPQNFHADCGFQSFAWVVAIAMQQPPVAISPSQAEGWRHLFAQHLLHIDQHLQTIEGLAVGGMKHDTDVHKRLTQLLKEHGVWAERADERAASIMERVPQDNIRSVLAAKKPWADLKQAANQARPPVKLIMQDELEAQIAARAQHRNQFGRKPAKAPQRPPDQGKSPPNVSAVELSVPVGVFKQQDGKVLGPLQAAQVQPNAEGVVLVDQADAAAVLKLPTPVTQKGLAVLVLATKDNASMHEGDPTRFPAMCNQTQEPIIASGYLYQLGSQAVQRNEPATKLAVDESTTEAVRCIVFRDQAGAIWDELLSHPVKTIFTNEPLLQPVSQGESPVIDVWDRQWVTKRYEKVKPINADMFVFLFRMIADNANELISKSGHGGVYFEPRSSCGRYPSSTHHVTWLPNLSYQEAKYAQQTSP